MTDIIVESIPGACIDTRKSAVWVSKDHAACESVTRGMCLLSTARSWPGDREIAQRGVSVLLVEQKLPTVQRICDHFCIMDKGRVVAGGAIGELDEGLVARYLTV